MLNVLESQWQQPNQAEFWIRYISKYNTLQDKVIQVGDAAREELFFQVDNMRWGRSKNDC